MPELPDLVYLERKLSEWLPGRSITAVEVWEPIVLRMLVPGSFSENLLRQAFQCVRRHGPFLVFALAERMLVMHLMLAGRLHDLEPGGKLPRDKCFGLALEDGRSLVYSDSRRMGKIYLDERQGDEPAHAVGIPLFARQGVDISGPEFTPEVFRAAVRGKRQQVRVFLMDQTVLSAIGNAYADEILFDARLHPKTRCSELEAADVDRLYQSVRKVMVWGITEVQDAAQPIDVKVRDHVRVRNRKGSPCPVCGTTIRRASVLGNDTFFCPTCQPMPQNGAARKSSLPWDRLPRPGGASQGGPGA